MSGFSVTTEQLLLKFDNTLSPINIRAFEPETERARLICFHGFAGNARDFDPLAEFLAANGVTVVAADMYGRGDSAHFAAGNQYTLRRMVQAAAAVLTKRWQGAGILGVGWGGLIALLGLAVSHVVPRSFIAVDLRLDYSVDTDPVIAAALADRGLVFPTEASALAHLRASYEFGALPDGADIANRVRQEARGYRLSHDDAITQRTQAFSGRDYDLRKMLGALGVPILLLDAGPGQALASPAVTAIGNLSPAGPLLLRSPAEHYLILGWLLAVRAS